VTDFVRLQAGNAYNLACNIPGLRLLTSLHRSRRVSIFSEIHCATLAAISPHLSNLYSCFKKLEQAASFTVCEVDVRERFRRISNREAEVAVLLCRGLTAGEIASKLFINVRTAQSHIQHLYVKLNVRTKREAISLLTNQTESSAE
jgi:DNA-binding CsgD family transcriptional regulator